MEKSLYLTQDDITEDVVIIKINQSYDPHMSALQLYDITRGCWRRKIESVESARYALATYKGEVVEVYKIDYWCHASELNRDTLPYNPERHRNRIGFFGSVAPGKIRGKYVEKSVKNFFKWGEAAPVKLIKAELKSTDGLTGR